MSKTLWTIVIIIIVAVGAWLWYLSDRIDLTKEPSTEGLPQLPVVSEEDTTTQIQQDLEQIDLGDIDKQFESIDADLNNL